VRSGDVDVDLTDEHFVQAVAGASPPTAASIEAAAASRQRHDRAEADRGQDAGGRSPQGAGGSMIAPGSRISSPATGQVGLPVALALAKEHEVIAVARFKDARLPRPARVERA
jgi:hypothetical protein